MEDYEPQELLMQNVQDIRKRLLDTERNLKKLSKIEKKGNYDEWVILFNVKRVLGLSRMQRMCGMCWFKIILCC